MELCQVWPAVPRSCIDTSSGKSYIEIYRSHEPAYVIEVGKTQFDYVVDTHVFVNCEVFLHKMFRFLKFRPLFFCGCELPYE